MKKNFTFILLSLLLFVVGGAKSQTALELKGGNNVELPSGDHPTSGTIQFKDKRAQYSYVTNGDWVDATAGTHTFEITLGSSGNEDCTLHIAALNEVVSGSTFDNGSIKAAAIIQEESITVTNNATLTLSVSSGYSAIILWQTHSSQDWRKVNIASFTRTVTGAAPSVNPPTISPASGTYDGDLSVTITPGEGNDHVKFTVTGNTDGTTYTNEPITSATTINLTGTSTITVTATGYDDENNASSEVTNTYTYVVAAPTITPGTSNYDGELTVTITPGSNNHHAKYTVSGSNENDTDVVITSATTLNLTGSSTITITATGYNSDESKSSSETECTYTYSVASGKTTVSYAIPGGIVNTAMYTYNFDSGGSDYIAKTGFDAQSNPGYDSSDDTYSGTYNLWLKNNNYKTNSYDSQLYINLNSSQWPAGTNAILHFALRAGDDFANQNGKGLEIAFQRNSDPWTVCGVFADGSTDPIVPTNEWVVYNLPVTVTNAAACEKLYINCGNFKGAFRFDEIILYKVEESATGGSNVFTSDDQVANIDKSEFSSLSEGDYICADVTGSPETIKLVCNGNDYALRQFNGGNLWGVKATAAMVTALSGNDSEFKGHDLTLNGISIYETTAVTETNTGSITKKNNTFVELTRSFTKDMWNTVCLPFKPTAAQADELFGSGYKIAKFTGVSETTMEFTSKDKEAFDFVAGQPYLVKPTENLSNSSPVVLANVNITAKNGATVTQDGYSFTGTFTTKSFAKGDWATTRFVATGNKLNTPKNENAMKALRCYFTVPAESSPAESSPAENSARGYAIDGFMDDDVPTDISATLNDNVQTTKVIYNLAGQRVANPTKGLYIVNGQKVVVK